jgi:hypothetical protein
MNEALAIEITAITAKFEAGIRRALKDLDTFVAKAAESGEKVKAVGQNLSLYITAPLLVAGTAMIHFATDTEEAVNKVDVAFKDSSQSIKDFAKDSLQSFGIASGTALNMAALFGDMATGMGINTTEAAVMSKGLVALSGDLASFKNISVGVAETALKSIFTGETESLKGLGIVMTEANLKAFALSEGISKNIKDMSEAEKVNLRYAFVLAKTVNAQGDFERTGGGAANQTRIFQEGLKELSATFGQYILPYFTKAITALNHLVKYFSELSPEVKKTILVIGGLALILGPVLVAFGTLSMALPVIAAGFAFLMGPIGLTVLALGAAGAALLAYSADTEQAIARIKKAHYSLDLFFANIFSDADVIKYDEAEIARLDKMIAKREIIANLPTLKRNTDGSIKTKNQGIKEDLSAFPRNENGTFKTQKQIDAEPPKKPKKPAGGLSKEEIIESLKKAGDAHEDGLKAYRSRIDAAIKKARDAFAEASSGIGILGGKTAISDPKDSPIAKMLTEMFNLDDATKNLDAGVAKVGDKIKESIQKIQIIFTKETLILKDFAKATTEMAGVFLGDALSGAFASVFDQDIEFNFKGLLGQFLAGLGEMVMAMAIKLGAFAKLKTAVEKALLTFGTGAIAVVGAAGLFALGAAMKGGGMAMSQSASGSTNNNVINNAPRFNGGGSNGQLNITIGGEFRMRNNEMVAAVQQVNRKFR